MNESQSEPANAGQDQPAVSWGSNNTGSRSVTPPDPHVIRSRRRSTHSPESAADRASRKQDGQIWIAWICVAGMTLTLLSRCVFGG